MADSTWRSIKVRVISGLLLAAILGIATLFPSAISWAINLAEKLYNHLKCSVSIPYFLLYFFILTSAIVILFGLFNLLSKKEKKQEITDYTQDSFFGVTWRWGYNNGLDSHLRPWCFCPNCETRLVYSENYFGNEKYTVLRCEYCNKDVLKELGSKEYLINKVIRQIERKVNTGEWVNEIQKREQSHTH